MSLLLDALKRAEQEKLARQAQSPGATESPEPSAQSEVARRRTLELEQIESGATGDRPAAAPAPRVDRERDQARVVFAAKQAEPAPAPAAASRNKAVFAIIGIALLLALAGGAYVWRELNPGGPTLARAPAPVPSPRPVTPAPPGAPVAAAPVTPPVTPPVPAPATAPAEIAEPALAGKVPPVAKARSDRLAPPVRRSRPQPRAAESLVARLLQDSAGAKPNELKLSRTIDAPRVPQEVMQGYDALRRGDAAQARGHYEAALKADGSSLDAHLGLATAAARLGDRPVAARHYRRSLELDPRNPSALAGMAALADTSRPERVETQLRADISQSPQSAALHFTLGNLYSTQSRWNEAQAAYFEAYRLDTENAEIAYNLAVSLDHLGQARLAADFYRRALASAQQDAPFDKAQVSRRIAELKPQ